MYQQPKPIQCWINNRGLWHRGMSYQALAAQAKLIISFFLLLTIRKVDYCQTSSVNNEGDRERFIWASVQTMKRHRVGVWAVPVCSEALWGFHAFGTVFPWLSLLDWETPHSISRGCREEVVLLYSLSCRPNNWIFPLSAWGRISVCISCVAKINKITFKQHGSFSLVFFFFFYR